MITEWDMYWLTRMDAIKEGFRFIQTLFGVLFSVGVVAVPIGLMVSHGEPAVSDFARRAWRRGALVWIGTGLALCVGWIGTAATPTTNELAAIWVIPKVANNEDVQAVGKDIAELAKQWIEELKPKKEVPKDVKE